MLATTSPITAPNMTAPLDLNGARRPLAPAETGQRQFKRHKNLPRPQSSRSQGSDASPSKQPQPQPDLSLDTSASSTGSQPISPHTLKHQPRTIGSGPELPPTPPTHSRTSSSSQSALPSSPTLADNSVRTPKSAQTIPPTTPPDQRSPPTPDVTPPQPLNRPKALRPHMMDRGASRTNTFDSRTDSFRTAREEPLSSEEEDEKSTVKAAVASGRTSQSTVRKGSNNNKSRMPNPQVIDMALARLGVPAEDAYTPRTRGELARFDGDWGSANDAEREWDDRPNRTVTVKKTRTPANKAKRDRMDVVEDAKNPVVSTGATRAVRNMSLNEQSPNSSSKSQGGTRSSSGPSYSDSSVSTSQKRSSGVSSRSFTSTVEAFLIDAPQPPQRQRTLRHVRKQSALRDPIPQFAEPAALVPERGRGRSSRPPITNHRPEHGRHDSFASNATVTSVASGKARRDVWKNGGIPVVVIPDRRASRSQSREPSLRSTSSRRSKRTQSLGSASLDMTSSKAPAPVFERPERRSRAFSFSDSSDTRTLDFPPAIPARSSSLSAPTSRHTSRVNSMTADSIRARDAVQRDLFKELPASPTLRNESTITKSPPRLASPLFASPKADSEGDARFDHDRSEETSRRGPARHTPFSIASVETNGTAPEVSEAIAMQLYAHQNSSLLMVNHSSRPSEVPELPSEKAENGGFPEQPTITMTAPGNEVPATPPQPRFTLEDVDSPLRNPRSPPKPPVEPPAITFTSATPSGATPAPDKALQMGNYFDTMAEVPSRRPSLVERALNRGRQSSAAYPPNSSKSQSLLKRALSLPRRRSSSKRRGLSPNTDYPQEGCTPPEENKLHPFWRPQWSDGEDDYYEDDHRPSRDDEEEDEEEHLRYPPIDNRPAKPKRRFSDKMKRTFAIMPIRDEEDYAVDDVHGPERRTIRRTSSGNLRVMRRRNSASSLRRRFSQSDRPYTAPDEEPHRSFWRGSSVKRVRSQSRRRFSLDDQLDEIRGLSRKLSERRREKRTQELRQKISGPRDVRDGVEEMLRSGNHRDQPHLV